MRDAIPSSVFDPIQRHLMRIGNHAQSGWEAGSEEEDTLTGHLGAQLQRDWSRAVVIDGQRWRWRVRYKKFRGRGYKAFEKESGADGIIQVEVSQGSKEEAIYKGLLFQAKKNSLRRDTKLIEQVGNMERIAPRASVIFVYRSDAYHAVDGDDYLKESMGQSTANRVGRQLGSYLGKEFLPCESGLRGMYYDGVRSKLLVPTPEGGIRVMDVRVKHRIAIEVEEGPRL